MLIISDLHGVIIDTLSILELRSELAERLYGIQILPEIFFRKEILQNALLTASQYQSICEKVYGEWEYVKQMKEVNGASQAIQKLSVENGVEVIIFTTVTEKMLDCAKRWLKKRKINCQIIGVGVGGDRQSLLRDFKPDIYIDDNPETLFCVENDSVKLLLFDWWYNQNVDLGHVKRVYNWHDILNTAGV